MNLYQNSEGCVRWTIADHKMPLCNSAVERHERDYPDKKVLGTAWLSAKPKQNGELPGNKEMRLELFTEELHAASLMPPENIVHAMIKGVMWAIENRHTQGFRISLSWYTSDDGDCGVSVFNVDALSKNGEVIDSHELSVR